MNGVMYQDWRTRAGELELANQGPNKQGPELIRTSRSVGIQMCFIEVELAQKSTVSSVPGSYET